MSEEEIPLEKRRLIFQQELKMLRDEKLIPKSEYIRISHTYDRYTQKFLEQRKHSYGEAPKEIQDRDLKAKEKLLENIDLNEKLETKQVEVVTVAPQIEKKPEKKPQKTAEQLRERNISIVLIMGVIFLLCGGLILATSTWGNLNAVLKVIYIGIVSVFFAGMAYVATKLKIKQTAFAFLTLASLFIPITILSASYYQIFGEYLSFQGDGSELIGFIGGIFCLLIYGKIARYFESKIFVWITFITFAITIYFAIGYVTFSNEMLFLLMSLVNLVLLILLDKVKQNTKFILFKSHIFQFISFKIIVEMFVILVFFTSNIIYSLTLLLLSLSFLLLAVKYKKNHFHYIFSILFTYGFIHFVYHSFLEEVSTVAFAILPILFLVLSKYLSKSHKDLAKGFMYTSIVLSGFVFLYAAARSWADEEAQIFLTLLVLTAQFVYLSLETKWKYYTYPALIFFHLAFYYLAAAIHLSDTANLLFGIAALVYVSLYLYNFGKLRLFKESSLYVSIFVMLCILFIKFSELEWLELSIGLAVVASLSYFTSVKASDEQMREVCTYSFPISLTLAMLTLHQYFNKLFENNLEFSVHAIVVAVLVIGIGAVLKKFFHIFFIIGQVLSFIACLFLVNSTLPAIWVTALLVVATAINGWSVYLYRHHLLWIPVLLTSVGVYSSLFAVFDFTSASLNIAFYLFGPLLFLALAEYIAKYSEKGKLYFFWLSQFMNVVAVLVGFFLIQLQDSQPWLYLLVLVFYLWSALRSKVQWQKYAFTYVGFGALYLQVLLLFKDYSWTEHIFSLTLFITAVLILLFWIMANSTWKKLINYYVIPFLHLAMLSHIVEVSTFGFPVKLTFIWASVMVVLLFSAWYLIQRSKWNNAIVAPLLLAWIYFMLYSNSITLLLGIIVLFVCMAGMLLLSKRYFTGIVKRTESSISLDFYRIFGLLYLIGMNLKVFSNEVSSASEEIFVSSLVVVYFLVIRLWTINKTERKIYVAAAILLVMYPYDIILKQILIPDVIITEVYVVSMFIIITLLLRKVLDYGRVTQMIEFVIVACLFLLLIMDALEGNTVTDALIIGTISLIAVLFGFMMKYKSFFLAGTGTILLNIYMNTNSFWGNIPWWTYLIIGGIILIAVASFFEWKKQKENATSKEILARNKERLKLWFNKWK